MNTKTVTNLVETSVAIAVREPVVERRQSEAFRLFLRAMASKRREEARHFLDVLWVWHGLREFLRSWRASVQGGGILTFVADSWFLQDLIKHLTPNQDEEIAYVTGISLGRMKFISRICDVKLEKQSVVYARATAKSCADALVAILGHGSVLHVMAHSHPGSGAAATHESSIDVNYLGKIQRAGADVVGIIVTRDGFVRFFTVEKPFQVLALGNGVTQVEENVFQITLPEKDRH